MDLSDLIEQDAIFPALRSQTKKQVLQDLSERAAFLAGLSPRDVYDTVTARERLGSTGIGGGIAIPHGKIAGLSRIRGVFGRLAKPVDFDSLDDQPVDLVFLLLAPEDSGAEHLKALSKIARLLRDQSVLGQLRALHDATTIHDLMTRTVPPFAA